MRAPASSSAVATGRRPSKAADASAVLPSAARAFEVHAGREEQLDGGQVAGPRARDERVRRRTAARSWPSAVRAAAGDCFVNSATSFVAESVNDATPATIAATTIATATTGFSRSRAVMRSTRVCGTAPAFAASFRGAAPSVSIRDPAGRPVRAQATAMSIRSIEIRDCHCFGPVSWTDVPFASTATVTGMSTTSNS